MEGGTYGRCESCRGEIGELRLRSLPASRLCLRCEGVTSTALPV
jgi:RNA polymerase-binding transcription factor DksA